MERNLRDLSTDKRQLKILGEITTYTFLGIIILMCFICLIFKNRGQCSYAIWQNIAYLQLIHWINLINIESNSEFEVFFKELAVIFRPFQMKGFCSDDHISDHTYKAMQIDSHGFINNSKELLFIYVLVLLFCFIVFLGKNCSKSLELAACFKMVKYSTLIRLHLLMLMDFMVYSLINIYYFTGESDCSTVNLILSIIFLVISGFWLVWIPFMINRKLMNSLNMRYDVIFESIETLSGEFQASFKTVNYQYYSIYLLYRFSVSFCLVVLGKSRSVQLFTISSFQLILSNS
jgi:hypothetical protein